MALAGGKTARRSSFGRADWEYVLNTFCLGYHAGYQFIQTKPGVCNGNFLGIGADDCENSVIVDDSAIYGLLITNGEFVAMEGDDPTMVAFRRQIPASCASSIARSGGLAIKTR